MRSSSPSSEKAQRQLTKSNARINRYITHPALSIDEMRVRVPEAFGMGQARPPTFTLDDWAARNPEVA